MVSIYNLNNPIRAGHIRLAKGSKEIFGTVISHDRDKTVTVSTNSFYERV